MKLQRRWSYVRCWGAVALLIGGAICTPGVTGESAGDPNEAGWDVTDRFAFVWDSVEVSSQVFNPSYTGRRDLYECDRTLAVAGKIHILDANDLVGMQVSDPNVLEVVDGDGNNVRWAPLPVRPIRQYQALKYEWPIPRNPFATPEPVLQPYDVSVSFCVDLSQELGPSLSLFQWCAYAVYAEDVIEVDVPFEASDDWIEAAPGLQIRVTKATVECCDYTYWTEVRHGGGTVQAFDARLSPAEPIADYLVMRTLPLDAQGQPVSAAEDDRVSPAIWSERVDSTSWGTAKCGGWLLVLITQAEIKSIRHVIVVHPAEVKVPFTLTDLPLPPGY
ncbi:MAG: hypothetical protein ACYTAS_08310 [Planctomycetota bacterium]|jgi:hypothetical protein